MVTKQLTIEESQRNNENLAFYNLLTKNNLQNVRV